MVYIVQTPLNNGGCFEVDSTESIWYIDQDPATILYIVLKLTPQSQYGIESFLRADKVSMF